MTRRVVVFNHFAAPLGSPGGTRHIELFTRLSSWSTRLIASNRNLLDGSATERGGILETVWVYPHNRNGLARVLSWISYSVTAFVRAVLSRDIDLVYGSSPHLLAGLTGLVVARLRRVPFVLEIRDVWPLVLVEMGALESQSLVYRALERLERWLYQSASQIVILAEGVEPHLRLHGVGPERITFIPNGADVAELAPSASRDTLRQRYGFEGLVAVYAGAHGPANGLDLLLDAAHALAEASPELALVLVGDGTEKTRLMARARREHLTNVRFLDAVPKREMGDLLTAADIGVHCLADITLFHSGVSPNKLFDYMAAGLPVVTNTPGEVAALVEASGAGLCGTATELAPMLDTLSEATESERREYGLRGRRFIESTRSRTAMAARLECMMNEIVASHGRRI